MIFYVFSQILVKADKIHINVQLCRTSKALCITKTVVFFLTCTPKI
jgi:hypothetical protein